MLGVLLDVMIEITSTPSCLEVLAVCGLHVRGLIGGAETRREGGEK